MISSPRLRTALAVVAALATTACFTGERPSFADTEAPPAVTDAAAIAVLQLLEANDERPVAIRYEVLRKFGNTTVEAVVARDRDRWSLTVGDVRFLDIAGSRSTCDLVTGRCSRGFDEARVSDVLTTVRFAKRAAATRLRRDAATATGDGMASTTDVPGGKATCVALPQPGGQTLYCADDLALLAVQDTADVRITRLEVDEVVDPALFDTTSPPS